MDKKYSKILPVKLHKDYTLIQGYSFPLCILLADDIFKGWNYENYTMPYIMLKGIDYFECGIMDAIEYGSRDNINTRLMRYSYLGKNIMSQVTDIYSVIQERINEDFYCIIFLDHYYISKMYYYHKKHYAHEILIYGFDDFNEEYYGIAFINQNLESFRISYDEMKEAYCNVFFHIEERDGWEEKMFMQIRCVGHTEEYPVDVEKFKAKMNCYHHSVIEQQDYYLHSFYVYEKNSQIGYGRDIIDFFLKYIHLLYKTIDNVQGDKTIEKYFSQYFPFHMFADFYRGLYKRFQFYGKDKVKQELLNEYKKISVKAEKIRINFIKAAILANKGDKSKVLKVFDIIEEDLIYIKEYDKLLCETIISEL